MKFLFPFIACFPCLAQLPVIPFVTQPNAANIDLSQVIPGKMLVWHKPGVGVWQDFPGTTPAVNGSNVEQWDDQSGNGNYCRWNNTFNPAIYVADGGTGNNHYPSLRFSGNTLFFSHVTTTFAAPISIYIVFAVTNGAAYNCICDSQLPDRCAISLSTAAASCYAGTSLSFNPNSWTSTQYNVLAVYFNGASSVVITNGVQMLTGNTGTSGGESGFNFGMLSGGGQPVIGYYTEIAAWNAVPTTAQSNTINSYFWTKYGTTPHS